MILPVDLQAESLHDFVDCSLAWKHFPNVTFYDYARRLALHNHRRQPQTFDPLRESYSILHRTISSRLQRASIM